MKTIREQFLEASFHVGKKIGGRVYVHKSYEGQFPGVEKAKAKLPKGFDYDVTVFEPETGRFSFIVSSDFDTADEPSVEGGYTVKVNEEPKKFSPAGWIYHHKWQFVGPDYKGFDVAASKARSKAWTSLPDVDKSRIGQRAYWAKNVEPRLK